MFRHGCNRQKMRGYSLNNVSPKHLKQLCPEERQLYHDHHNTTGWRKREEQESSLALDVAIGTAQVVAGLGFLAASFAYEVTIGAIPVYFALYMLPCCIKK